MEELRNNTRETSVLNLRVGFEQLVVDKMQGYGEVLFVTALGLRALLWSGAQSKAMLAFPLPDEIQAVLNDLKKSKECFYVSGEVIDIDRLTKELASIREEGFAVTVGERVLASTGLAAPIFGRGHKVVSSISVAGRFLGSPQL